MTSHRIKDFLLIRYLRKLNNNEIILFTDGYDTLLLATEDEIMKKFREFGKETVFSAERNCWPDTELEEYFPKNHASPFKYLNSGGFIGTTGMLKSLLEREVIGKKDYHWSNQYAWILRYLDAPEHIALDHHCEIFYTASTDASKRKYFYKKDRNGNPKKDYRHPEFLKTEGNKILQEISFSNDRIRNLVTQTSPCHVHFNGPIGQSLLPTEHLEKIKPWYRAGF